MGVKNNGDCEVRRDMAFEAAEELAEELAEESVEG